MLKLTSLVSFLLFLLYFIIYLLENLKWHMEPICVAHSTFLLKPLCLWRPTLPGMLRLQVTHPKLKSTSLSIWNTRTANPHSYIVTWPHVSEISLNPPLLHPLRCLFFFFCSYSNLSLVHLLHACEFSNNRYPDGGVSTLQMQQPKSQLWSISYKNFNLVLLDWVESQLILKSILGKGNRKSQVGFTRYIYSLGLNLWSLTKLAPNT